MTALLESIQAAFADRAAAKSVLDHAMSIGLPGARSEQWKYTSLRALSARSFHAPSDTLATLSTETLQAIHAFAAPRIVFVNGEFDSANSDLTEVSGDLEIHTARQHVASDNLRFPFAHEIFAKLNAAIARHGMQLSVGKNVHCSKALQAIFVTVKTEHDLAIHYRHTIALHENASLELVEHHIAQDSHQHLSNHLCDIALGAGAELTHARIQQDAVSASHFLRTEASLQNHAVYRRLDLELGAQLSRHDLKVELSGDGASVHANGSLIAAGRRHVDTRLDIRHLARDTSCHLLWRGLATGRGRAVFHGGILIEKGADGAAAHLSNKNLLLSDNAEIDTQPVLVIHADEVAASHGATVGRLDAGHLFYLRARGIPEAQAKAMLTHAFCKQTLQVLADDSLAEIVAPHLENALQEIEVQA